jgi:hypothetical protein
MNPYRPQNNSWKVGSVSNSLNTPVYYRILQPEHDGSSGPPKLSARIRTFVANKNIREQHVTGVCTQGILFYKANIYGVRSHKNIILFTEET